MQNKITQYAKNIWKTEYLSSISIETYERRSTQAVLFQYVVQKWQ
jgi:hypothetical protein